MRPVRSGRRWLARTVWLAVAAGVSLVGVELGARWLGIAPSLPDQYAVYVEDPILPHKPRPGATIVGPGATNEFDFEYRHNSLGLREREIPEAKPPGTFRILGLGDSFTYGGGAKAENVYLARLERRLNGRGSGHPRIEVMNAGIPRFFPEAERLFLEHYGLPFQPDLALVAFVPNDVIDTFLGLKAIRVLPDGRLVSNAGARLVEQLGDVTTVLYTHSHALRILIAAYLRSKVPEEQRVRSEEVFRPDGFHEPAWRELERQYGLMADLARGRGIQIVFVHLPQMGPWDSSAAYPPARLAAWAQRNGLAFVDVLPAFQADGHSELLFWPKDRHPTDAGHAVIADALFEALTGRGLVP